MKILILHRYFWPQAYPYAQMLKHIAEALAEKNEVSILSTDTGSLDEKSNRYDWVTSKNITIQTLTLGPEKQANLLKKAFNSFLFGCWVLYKLFMTKTDVVMVATTPPVIIAMIVRWVSYLRGFKYVYHCQDIHPEGMLLSDSIQRGFIFNILLNIDKKNINSAWRVITLSQDMKHTLKMRGCKSSHISIINNFIFKSVDSSRLSFSKDHLPDKRSKLQFLFSGSLGRSQNLEVLMKSLLLLKHRDDLFFKFMGDGVMFNEMNSLKKKHHLDNVEFLGQCDLEVAVSAMLEADIGIVSIGNKITSVAYPSKTMMYLGSGLPVLAIVDEDTELFNFVNSNHIGKAVPPTSAENIAKALEIFADESMTNAIDRIYVKKVADYHFGKRKIIQHFLDIFV